MCSYYFRSPVKTVACDVTINNFTFFVGDILMYLILVMEQWFLYQVSCFKFVIEKFLLYSHQIKICTKILQNIWGI